MSIAAVLANEQRWHVEVTDVLEGAASLLDGCLQAIVTSPPYWGLRSYLPSDHPLKCFEIGSEPTPQAYIEKMVGIFRVYRRCLRDDGTLWINMGDNYAQDKKWGGTTGGKHAKGLHGGTGIGRNRTQTELPSGSQVLMPHRLALAMIDDGWTLRSTIIWAKKSPMPESISGWRWRRCRVKVATAPRGSRADSAARNGKPMADYEGHDFARNKYAPCPGCDKCKPNGGYVLRQGRWRPTTAHEYIFLFSKSERYFADGDAAAEHTTGGAHPRGYGLNPKAAEIDAGNHRDRPKQNDSFSIACNEIVQTRNPRSFWLLSNEPEKAKHFAVFPSDIPRRCLRAATSSGGCCPACGSPYAPVVESERLPTRPGIDTKCTTEDMDLATAEANGWNRPMAFGNRDPQRHVAVTNVSGYRATCGCNAGEPVPCVVADIFSGSGTTGRVAYSMGLRYIGIELSEEYAAISREKIVRPFKVKPIPRHKRPMSDQQRLFE